MKKREIIALCLFVAMLLAAWFSVNSILKTEEKEETALVYDAVRAAAVTCYAVEGAYPGSVEYLSSHYGLSYDEDRFVVFYNAFASNIMPEIRVVRKGDLGL